jgi:hypothetical protein
LKGEKIDSFTIYALLTFVIGIKTDLINNNMRFWISKGTLATTIFAYWDTFFFMLLLPIHYLLSDLTIRFDSDRIFFIHALFTRMVRFVIGKWLIFYIFRR